jgi:hypothetical protein
MFIIACIFFGSRSVPSLETIKPKIIPENTINAHLSTFRPMPYYLRFWKHNLSFCKWLSMSLYIVKSFKNIFIKLSKYSLNVLVIIFWYVGSPFLIPNDITFHIKAPPICNKYSFVSIFWSYTLIEIGQNVTTLSTTTCDY